MVWLILGLALWVLAHGFKRFLPEARARLGNAGKGLVALGTLAGVVLMVIGYRAAPFIPVYSLPDFMVHVNNLMMVAAFLLVGAGSVGSWLSTRMRHPMLIGFKTWALAHLLVNGDLASIILFGGLLVWAVLQLIAINRAEPDWTPGTAAPTRRDAILVVVWLVAFGITAAIHGWIGPSPFPG